MNKYKYLVKNSLLFTLSTFTNKFLIFVCLPLYTYYFTTEQYASIDLATISLQLVQPLFTMSVADAVLRFAIDKNENKSNVFTIAFSMNCLSSVMVIIFLPLLSLLGGLGNYKMLFFLLFVSSSFNLLLSNFARTLDKIKLVAIVSIIGSTVTVSFNVLFISIFKFGISGYFCASITGYILMSICYFIICKVYKYINFKSLDKDLLRRILSYTIPLIPNSIFWWIVTGMDRYFLVYLSSMSIVGLYSVAMKIPAIMNTIISIFNQAWNISAFQEIESNDSKLFFSNIFELYNCILILSAVFLMVLSRYIAIILFQKDFYYAWTFIPILLMSLYYNSLSTFYGSIYSATKKTKYLFITSVIGAAINLVLNYILIIKFGGIGATIATCVSYFTIWVLRMRDTQKFMPIDIKYKKIVFQQILLAMVAICETSQITISHIFATIIAFIIFSLNSKLLLNLTKRFPVYRKTYNC